MTKLFSFVPAPMMAPPDANGPAGFTTLWHGHGANHQGNNAPGDSAGDRHNFGDAEAGKSGHNPTAGSTQDDFSAATGLPVVDHGGHGMEMSADEGDADDLLVDWV